MKRFVAILLSCLALTNISAIEKGNWGIKATFDLSVPSKWNVNNEHFEMFKPGAGFSVGGVYYQPISKGFFFEPGLSFYYDTYSFKDLKIAGANGQVATNDPSVRKAGLRLPLQFGYEFIFTEQWKLSVFTGPELSYTFSQNAHVKHSELLDEDFNPDLLGIKEHKRFDCAWKIGVAIPVDFIWIGVDAAFGLTDLQPGNVSFRENRVSVSATYYF